MGGLPAEASGLEDVVLQPLLPGDLCQGHAVTTVACKALCKGLADLLMT